MTDRVGETSKWVEKWTFCGGLFGIGANDDEAQRIRTVVQYELERIEDKDEDEGQIAKQEQQQQQDEQHSQEHFNEKDEENIIRNSTSTHSIIATDCCRSNSLLQCK